MLCSHWLAAAGTQIPVVAQLKFRKQCGPLSGTEKRTSDTEKWLPAARLHFSEVPTLYACLDWNLLFVQTLAFGLPIRDVCFWFSLKIKRLVSKPKTTVSNG